MTEKMTSYADGRAVLWAGDCLDLLAAMPENSVDSIVTDPPYGLGFMGKEWDALPPGREWAEACLRVLKPGGHLLAFGGSRTWHRLAAAIEDGGFEIRDSLAWLYGSGFPKSMDVSKAIDKRGGRPDLAEEIGRAIKAARESRGWTKGRADEHFCGGTTNWSWFEGRRGDYRPPTPTDFDRIVKEWPELAPLAAAVAAVTGEVVGTKTSGIGTAFGDGEWASGPSQVVDVVAPATSAAQEWQGWGTALKPAFEPIVVARKRFPGTVAANVLAHGTGALNIDGCRIAVTDEAYARNHSGDRGHAGTRAEGSDTSLRPGGGSAAAGGRFPANVLLDEDQAAVLDHQAPRTGAAAPASGPTKTGRSERGSMASGFNGTDAAPAFHSDMGGASRFFYVAKAPKSERVIVDGVAHPTVKPLALMRWLIRLVTPPGGLVLDTFAGSGTTGEAALLEGFCVLLADDPSLDDDYTPLIVARLLRGLATRADEAAAAAAAAEAAQAVTEVDVADVPGGYEFQSECAAKVLRLAEQRAKRAAKTQPADGSTRRPWGTVPPVMKAKLRSGLKAQLREYRARVGDILTWDNEHVEELPENELAAQVHHMVQALLEPLLEAEATADDWANIVAPVAEHDDADELAEVVS